jgi:2'-5' RNA ligase
LVERQRSQRLFFALWPEPEMRLQIARAARELEVLSDRAVHVADLHVTLVFLGSVSSDLLPCIDRVASRIVAESFVLEIDSIGYWPRPKILWCGPSRVPEPLQRLVGDLQSGLRACGFEPEQRPYRPHITLARKARSQEGLALEPPLTWSVREFALIRSDTGRPPPFYDVQKKWVLDS